MKKLFYILCGVLSMYACKDDAEKVTPSNISNVTYQAGEGSVLLRWAVPADSAYEFVRVTYNDPWTGKKNTLLASRYSDSLRVNNMLQKFGAYTFTLQPVSVTGHTGEAVTIEATCNPRPADVVIASSQPIALTANMLSSNSLATQSGDDGGVAALVDGDVNTFYHSSYNPTVFPAWIDVALTEGVDSFTFGYQNRNRDHGKAQTIEVYGSNDKTTWTLIKTINSGLPTAASSAYTSAEVRSYPTTYTNLRFKVTASGGGNTYFNMAEFKLTKNTLTVYDPENK